MINSNAYSYINVLQKAGNASYMRQNVIANNIANVDTPNYKRKDVQFESFLKSAIQGSESLSQTVSAMDMNSLNGMVYTDQANLSYRMDGNNVDIDVENANLAENQIRFNTIVDSIGQEFSRLKAVLSK